MSMKTTDGLVTVSLDTLARVQLAAGLLLAHLPQHQIPGDRCFELCDLARELEEGVEALCTEATPSY